MWWDVPVWCPRRDEVGREVMSPHPHLRFHSLKAIPLMFVWDKMSHQANWLAFPWL